MGALMRRTDWSRTPLGPVAAWPQSLRTAVSILLESRFPMYLAWGPQYVQLYNDGYRPILGSTKHPAAMGLVASETFAESWHIIGPMFDDVRRGIATGAEDWMLPLDRHGYLEECYFTFSYSPIRDESGGVGGVHVTVTETTERVLGTRRLHVLHELSERTTHAKTPEQAVTTAAKILDGDRADVPFALFYLLSPDGETARLIAQTGVPEGAPVGVPTIALSGAGVDGWPLGEVARSGQPQVVTGLEARFGALPGGAWPEPVHTAVLHPIERPGQDRPYGMLVAGVSARRALDKDYRDFFSLIAGHVATALTNARALEEERRRAEELAELDRAKTTFFSDVSHEFRTPLTLLLGPAEDALAAAAGMSVEDRERWALVHRNALRLSKLVNTLLDFARIEAGRVQACYQPTDLGALTGELTSMFRSAIERAGLKVVLDIEPLDEPIYLDREMWEKIVLNLLSNALKFTFEGEIRVSLRCADDHVAVAVRDTGAGIPAEELPRIFDRFRRVRGARSRTHEGTGIGLALVQELARLHGGHVSVESAAGSGTTFTVLLPRGAAHLAPELIGEARAGALMSARAAPYLAEALRWLAPDGEPADSPPPSIGVVRRRARIVLADDNADMREYVARLLRGRWDVEAVSDGAAALAAIRRHPPELVLADVMMPGLDGFGLVRALRADPATRAIPVVLLSARAGEEATAEGLSAGANDYLVKPFSARALLARVASQLAAAEVGSESRAVAEAERTRLYSHFMQAPFPIAVLRGPHHTFELANDAALRVWGKKPSIIGQPLRLAFPELVGQPFSGYIDQILRTGVAYEGKEELARLARGPGGAIEDVYFNFVYAPLRDRGGEVEGIILCGFEVTAQVLARRQVERSLAEAARLNEQLEEAERLFRALIDNLPDLAWSSQPDGYIDFYNRRWYEYTGTTFEQMAGWGWKSVHDPSKVDEVVTRWQRSIATGQRFEMEFPLRGADGVFRWFLTRVVPLHDGQGRIVRWIGTNIDIHELHETRKTTEALLAEVSHQAREMEVTFRAMLAAKEAAEQRVRDLEQARQL